jgi:5'-3' exoribonuclease 2
VSSPAARHPSKAVNSCCRYPLIIQDCIEEWPQEVGGVEIPVDFSQPNPNGMEFDNLYLVSALPLHPFSCARPLPCRISMADFCNLLLRRT